MDRARNDRQGASLACSIGELARIIHKFEKKWSKLRFKVFYINKIEHLITRLERNYHDYQAIDFGNDLNFEEISKS